MAARVYPVGAELVSATEAHVRVWAPDHASVTLVIDGRTVALERRAGGYHACSGRRAARLALRLPLRRRRHDLPRSGVALAAGRPRRPVGDRRSRRATRGRTPAWPGVSLPGQVLYELHVGTFTPEGTWRAAEAHLAAAARRRRHGDPDDAGGGVRRRASAGATTACSGSRRSTATARRPICSTSSTPRTGSAWP